jgi:hypothetical protein
LEHKKKRAIAARLFTIAEYSGERSRSACDFAPHFVASLFVNAGQIVLLAPVLLGITQNFVRTGTTRLPIATREANIRTPKMVIALTCSALCALRCFSDFGHGVLLLDFIVGRIQSRLG